MFDRTAIVDFSDTVVADSTRLATEEIRYMQDVHNVNTCDGCDTWLDDEIPVGYTEVIDEDEFFQRYFLEEN